MAIKMDGKQIWFYTFSFAFTLLLKKYFHHNHCVYHVRMWYLSCVIHYFYLMSDTLVTKIKLNYMIYTKVQEKKIHKFQNL